MTTNAQLTQQINDLLSAWNQREAQFRAWLAGTPNGGPNGDGKYPLTDAAGVTQLVDSPAKLADTVGGPAGDAAAAQALAEAARDTTITAKDRAVTAETVITGLHSEVITNRNLALLYRNDAAAFAAQLSIGRDQAVAAKTAAEAARDAALISETNAATSEANALASADAAAASALQAATFNPADFYTKVASDSRFKAIGYVPDWSEITSKPVSFPPSAHGHVISDVSGLQTALDGKQAAGSYAAAVHTHVIGDVTGLQTALDGKQAAGSYAAAVHGHVIADVSGLQTALDGKQAAGSYAAASHTHVIADVTGLQAALDGKQPAGSYLTGITGSMVTTALGYTPANKAGDTFTGSVGFAGNVYNTVGGAKFFANSGNINYLYAANSGLYVQNATDTANILSLTNGGSLTASADMRAPIFYDSDNTAYYVDPAGTSNLNVAQAITLRAMSSVPGNYGGISSSWGGNSGYPTLYGDTDDRWVMLINPHISYTQNGVNGFTGTMTGSTIRMAGNPAASTYWDIGVGTSGLGADVFGIGRSAQWNGYWDNGGNVWSRTSHRAPIFYDSDNTNYYVDAGSVSSLYDVSTYYIRNKQTGNRAMYLDGSTYNMFADPTGTTKLWLGTGGDPNNYYNASTHYFRDNSSTNAVLINVGGVQAPMYYDSNDTAYYVDPHGTSYLNAGIVSGEWKFRSNKGSGVYSGASSAPPLQAYSDDGGAAFMSFHRGGAYAVNFGLDPDNYLRIGGWSASANRWVLDMNGNNWITGSFHAPVFYDSNDTSYYVNPNGASNFIGLNVANTIGGYISGAKFSNDSENKDDITTRTESGFWQSSTGTTAEGWPINDNDWQHMISCTHSNDGNYFAMQLAAGFFSQGLFYRSVNNNGAQAWSRVALYNNSYEAPLYANVYYDSNDTGFYADATGNSRFRNICLGGGSGFDATIHIVGAQGGYDRLTQMSPNAASKPALNIMASRNSGNGDQWWSWGVQTDNTWKIQAGVGFGGNGITVDGSGNFTATGNVTAYSDARLKKEVETISGALGLISQLRGVRYTRIDSGERHVGVIAQETLSVIPEVVQRGTGDDDTLSVAYGNLVGVLIEAIKELRAEVEALKNA